MTGTSDEVWTAVQENVEYLKSETLAAALDRGKLAGIEPVERDVAGESVKIYVKVV